jgi:hypothetical protein
MVLEDREDKRDNANADADDDDKEDEGAMDVKIEAKLNGSDQEDGQLPAVESETPGAVPIKEERGEDKDSQPQGEKRKEMPSSPLKIREDDDAASVTTKRRRVESSPLHGAPSASSPGDTTNATVGGASTASAAPRT